VRAVFHEEDDARAVVARLRADGFGAEAARERFAGEDDDEDHPWAVMTDAPEFALEILAEEYDGWVDHDDPVPPSTPPAPLDLPTEPRRVKGHFTD
jgi:8-oxo-dGTP diphosphatase